MDGNMSVTNNSINFIKDTTSMKDNRIVSSSDNTEIPNTTEKKNLTLQPGMNETEQNNDTGKGLMTPVTYSRFVDTLSDEHVRQSGDNFDRLF